jgi:hypothetical protein
MNKSDYLFFYEKKIHKGKNSMSNALLSPPLISCLSPPIVVNQNQRQHHNNIYQNGNGGATKFLSNNKREATSSSSTSSSKFQFKSPSLPNQKLTQPNNNNENHDLTKNQSNKRTHLDAAYIRHIQMETRRFSSLLTQSEIECKSVMHMRANLAKAIIEICQMATTHSSTSPVVMQARVHKIRQVVRVLLRRGGDIEENEHDTHDYDFDGDDDEDNDNENEKDMTSFYDICLNEACVQLCQLKPTLLTRGDDLKRFAKKILQNCSIVSDKEEMVGEQNGDEMNSR